MTKNTKRKRKATKYCSSDDDEYDPNPSSKRVKEGPIEIDSTSNTVEIITVDEEEDIEPVKAVEKSFAYTEVPKEKNFVDGKILVQNNLYVYHDLLLTTTEFTFSTFKNNEKIQVTIPVEKNVDCLWAVVAQGWESFGFSIKKGIPALGELPVSKSSIDEEQQDFDVAFIPHVGPTNLHHAQFCMTLRMNSKTLQDPMFDFRFIERVDIDVPRLRTMILENAPVYIPIYNPKDADLDLGGSRRTRSRVAEKRESIKNPIPNDIIVDYTNSTGQTRLKLYFFDLNKMNEGDQLNDVLIDLYMEHIKDKYYRKTVNPKKIFTFPTLFYRVLKNDSKRTAERNPKNVKIFEQDMILIPYGDGYHWMLMVVLHPGDKEKRTFMYCDSMENAPDYSYFQEYFELRYKIEFPESNEVPIFKTCYATLPQQEGEIDCGLFVIENAERIMNNFPTSTPIKNKKWYNATDIEWKRKKIRNKIMKMHIKNLCKEIVDIK